MRAIVARRSTQVPPAQYASGFAAFHILNKEAAGYRRNCTRDVSALARNIQRPCRGNGGFNSAGRHVSARAGQLRALGIFFKT